MFNQIDDQVAGVDFEITMTALDSEENVATGFAETVTLTTTAGTITPDEALFSEGTISLNVSVSDAGNDQTITAESNTGEVSGTSNSFNVTEE